MRLAEEHLHAQRLGDLAVQRHLLALIPGQRPAQLRGQWRQGRYQCVADRPGGVPAPRQVDQDGEPAGAAGQGADRRPVERAGDQITLPVPGFAAAGGRRGPLADHRHAGQRPGPADAGAAVRLAVPPAGPQQGGQVAAQPAQLRPVDGLIDRLVHQVSAGIAGELGAQRPADLLRAPPFLQPARYELAQHRISVQLAAARPGLRPAASRCAANGRYWPLRRSRLRRNSLLIVDALRPNCPAIARTPSPDRRRSAMRTRSSSDRYRGEPSALRAPATGG
jgi:hypothetical protein